MLLGELSDSLLNFPGKRLFRLDRNTGNGKIRGGGVYIYVSDKLAPYSEIDLERICTAKDFEALTVNVDKPNTRFMHISCMYKPPPGNNGICLDFIKKIYRNTRREIWLLGDLNIDFLNRTCDVRLKFINAFKALGIKQLISRVTRPNPRGGTCIDWIPSSLDFIKDTLWVLSRDESLVHVSIDISLITKDILDHVISLES